MLSGLGSMKLTTLPVQFLGSTIARRIEYTSICLEVEAGKRQHIDLVRYVREKGSPHNLHHVRIFSSQWDKRNVSTQFGEPFLRVLSVYPYSEAPDPLVIELVMMIFAREQENRLEVSSSWPHQWTTGGFGVQAFPGANFSNGRENALNARQPPLLQGDEYFDLYIRKTGVPHRISDTVKTRFVINDSLDVERAAQSLEENNPTWEEKLSQGRIVLCGDGPVLASSGVSRYF
jgi:hypothetical protein